MVISRTSLENPKIQTTGKKSQEWGQQYIKKPAVAVNLPGKMHAGNPSRWTMVCASEKGLNPQGSCLFDLQRNSFPLQL